jgi:hypothetical protein
MSLSSSPVCGCGGRPRPRSSKMPAADTHAAGETASWLTMPASTLMHRKDAPVSRAVDRAGHVLYRPIGRAAPPGVLFMPAYNRLCGRIVQRVINTIDLRAGYTEIMGHPSAQVPHNQFRAADGLVFGSRRSGAYCAPPLSTGHGMRDPPVAGRCLAN